MIICFREKSNRKNSFQENFVQSPSNRMLLRGNRTWLNFTVNGAVNFDLLLTMLTFGGKLSKV